MSGVKMTLARPIKRSVSMDGIVFDVRLTDAGRVEFTANGEKFSYITKKRQLARYRDVSENSGLCLLRSDDTKRVAMPKKKTRSRR